MSVIYKMNKPKSTVSASRLKSVGKNLFSIDEFDRIKSIGGGGVYDSYYKLKPNTTYTASSNIDESAPAGIYFGGGSSSINGVHINKPKTMITDANGNIRLSLRFEHPAGAGILAYQKLKAQEIWLQIEEGTVATPYEPYVKSEVYIPNVGELRSVPNGTKDEVNLTTGVKTQNVSEDTLVSDTVYDTLDTSTYTNVDVVITTAFADAKAGTTGADGQTHYYNKDGVELAEVAQADIDLEASAGKYYWGEDKKLYIIVAKGDYADIAAARTGLGTTTLTYQLAQPIETNVPAQMLTGGPNHTVMWLPEVPDAGVCNNGISILRQDLPIKGLKKLSKIDFYTGEEIELDVTKAVIAADKKSFTHPDLTKDDIVFFVYEYPPELSTLPEMDVEYYDSRYVIEDTEDGKLYSWKIISTNGVASIELTEVV